MDDKWIVALVLGILLFILLLNVLGSADDKVKNQVELKKVELQIAAYNLEICKLKAMEAW